MSGFPDCSDTFPQTLQQMTRTELCKLLNKLNSYDSLDDNCFDTFSGPSLRVLESPHVNICLVNSILQVMMDLLWRVFHNEMFICN